MFQEVFWVFKMYYYISSSYLLLKVGFALIMAHTFSFNPLNQYPDNQWFVKIIEIFSQEYDWFMKMCIEYAT